MTARPPHGDSSLRWTVEGAGLWYGLLVHILPLRLLAVLSLAATSFAEAPPEPMREFRGAWVASVHNLNWPSRAGLPVAEQQRELRAILDKAAGLRLNAILLQVRPSCDALYASKLEPWSAFLTGKMGRAPEPFYDPLAFAVTEAHARGLELHAWVNPFRAIATASGGMAATHISQTHPEWVRRYGTQSWLDPGEPAAREYVRSVIMDLVRRYDLDGLHIDDYFYPYPAKDKEGAVMAFPDRPTYQRYRVGQGTLSLEDWRRDNINQFVETLYRSIKAEKRWVKFGISPFGIWRPRVPPSTIAFLDAYGQLFADSRRWLAEGWCDYFSPQLYWSIKPAAQSFPALLEWWHTQNEKGRHLWPGIATERIGKARPATEMIRQIGLTRSMAPRGMSAGAVHWEMKSLAQDRGGIAGLLREQSYKDGALVPASRWLGAEAPAAPRAERRGGLLTWKPAGDAPARWWAVQTKRGERWELRLLPAQEKSAAIGEGVEAVALRAVDRFGNMSAAAEAR